MPNSVCEDLETCSNPACPTCTFSTGSCTVVVGVTLGKFREIKADRREEEEIGNATWGNYNSVLPGELRKFYYMEDRMKLIWKNRKHLLNSSSALVQELNKKPRRCLATLNHLCFCCLLSVWVESIYPPFPSSSFSSFLPFPIFLSEK